MDELVGICIGVGSTLAVVAGLCIWQFLKFAKDFNL